MKKIARNVLIGGVALVLAIGSYTLGRHQERALHRNDNLEIKMVTDLDHNRKSFGIKADIGGKKIKVYSIEGVLRLAGLDTKMTESESKDVLIKANQQIKKHISTDTYGQGWWGHVGEVIDYDVEPGYYYFGAEGYGDGYTSSITLKPNK